MADILEFTTTPRAEDPTTDGDAFVFRLDGVEIAARRPKDALIAQLGPISSRRTPGVQKVKIALDFLDDCLAEPGKTVVRDRLLDPADPLDVEQCMDILTAIGDHWKQQNKAAGGS